MRQETEKKKVTIKKITLKSLTILLQKWAIEIIQTNNEDRRHRELNIQDKLNQEKKEKTTLKACVNGSRKRDKEGF